MIHATRFVAGVALKNIGAGLVTVTLTQVEGGSRARAAARFMVDVQHASMGEGERVRFMDARGYPEALQLGQVVQWLSKHMSGGAVSVRINVTDATRLPAPWTPSRINAMAAKFAAVDPDALREDAAAKVATVTSWADSGRRAAVLDAAARMNECAAFVEWVRGERAEWPGAGDGVIEPPPPPPAPAPEPPAPAPEPPPPPPPPPAPTAPTARAALRVNQQATVQMSQAVPVGVLVVGGERLAGTLSSDDRVLWYSLDVGQDQWIALETHAAAGVDTVLAICSQAGQVVGVNDNGAGLLSRLTLNDPNENTADNVTVPAGSYLVGVALNPVTFGHDWDVTPGAVPESKDFEISAVALQAAPPTPAEPPTADYVLTPEIMGTLSTDFHHIGDGWQTFAVGLGLHHVTAWGESRPVLMHPDVNNRGSTGKMVTVLCAPVEVESVTMSIVPRPSDFHFDTEVFLEMGDENMNAFVAFRLVGDGWRVNAGQTEVTGAAGALVDAVTFWPKTGAVRLRFVGGSTQDVASVQLPEHEVSALRLNVSAGAVAGLQVERAIA